MKFVAVALAFVAAVSAQGSVDPSKLGTGWCSVYTDDSCKDVIAPAACGANSTLVSHCASTFSMDMVCMKFDVSCTCTPKEGGEKKDLSTEAFNETFKLMPYGMCNNLLFTKNSTGPGIISGDYKPDGKRPNKTAAVPSGSKPSGSASSTGSAAGAGATGTPDNKSGAANVQAFVSTVALAAITLGMAML
ncbi:hypothetical protein BG004_008454 [Podila humilis]|nr:hypothetical protein BG004_008454 [Podila humilis]